MFLAATLPSLMPSTWILLLCEVSPANLPRCNRATCLQPRALGPACGLLHREKRTRHVRPPDVLGHSPLAFLRGSCLSCRMLTSASGGTHSQWRTSTD